MNNINLDIKSLNKIISGKNVINDLLFFLKKNKIVYNIYFFSYNPINKVFYNELENTFIGSDQDYNIFLSKFSNELSKEYSFFEINTEDIKNFNFIIHGIQDIKNYKFYLTHFLNLINKEKYFILYIFNSRLKEKYIINIIKYLNNPFYRIFNYDALSKKNIENNELLYWIFNKNPIALAIFDNNFNIIRSNLSFQNILIKNTDILNSIKDIFSNLKITSERIIEDNININENNFSLKIIPIINQEGVLEKFLINIIDNTVNHKLYKELENIKDRYKKLISELPMGFVIMTADGFRINMINQSLAYSIGIYDISFLIGHSLLEYFDITEDKMEAIKSNLNQYEQIYQKISAKQNYGGNLYSVSFRKIILENREFIEATFQDITLENRLYEELADKNAQLNNELETAKKIWEHILTVSPLIASNIKFDSFIKPSLSLGGDFFDIYQIDEDNVAVVIADVSGHGVPASLLTSILKITFEISPKHPKKISETIKYVQSIIKKTLQEDQYVTLFYGVFNLDEMSFSYINCGHPYPILIDKNNNLMELKGITLPLGSGLIKDLESEIKTIEIKEETKIFFYTDGLLSFKNENGIIKNTDVINIVNRFKNHKFKSILKEIYDYFEMNYKPIIDDDITMLLIEIKKEKYFKKTFYINSNVLEIDVVIYKILQNLNKIIQLSDEERWRFHTAAYEAIINAIEHGNLYEIDKKVYITYYIYKNYLVLKVKDEGKGFSLKDVPDPLADENLTKPSGRGIYMIKKFADKVKYNKKGNELTFYIKVGNER